MIRYITFILFFHTVIYIYSADSAIDAIIKSEINSTEFPQDYETLVNLSKPTEINKDSFYEHFFQMKNSPFLADYDMSHLSLLMKAELYGNELYFIEANTSSYKVILLCCFNRKDRFPRLLMIHHEDSERHKSLIDFTFDKGTETLNITRSDTFGESHRHFIDSYNINDNGVNFIGSNEIPITDQIDTVIPSRA